MKQCPKCSCTKINGPYYKKAFYSETLEYICGRCSYKTTTPTDDAEEMKPILRQIRKSELAFIKEFGKGV